MSDDFVPPPGTKSSFTVNDAKCSLCGQKSSLACAGGRRPTQAQPHTAFSSMPGPRIAAQRERTTLRGGAEA
jgi:hypothetical protein